MSELTHDQVVAAVKTRRRRLQGGLALAFVALLLLKFVLPEGLIRPSAGLVLPLADWINAIFSFLIEDLGLIHVTRGFAAGIKWLLEVMNNILLGGRKGFGLPALPWMTVVAIAFMVGYYLKGWRLALLCGGTFLFLAIFGQWKIAMETLAMVLVTVPVAVVIGLICGIVAAKNRRFENTIAPILNVAQSLPHFSYLIPVVVFFGVGTHAGAIATIIFATPPMVRMTLLGMKQVSPQIVESGLMSGCTKTQLLWRVEVPSARHDILVGVNQVIMQCLAMVVIASFIGAPGLGYKLLLMLQSLKLGKALELGVSIVLIAIMLDRLSLAWAERQPVYHGNDPFWVRYRIPLIGLGVVIATLILAQFVPYLYLVPRKMALSTAPFWDAIIDWITLVLFDYTQALRTFLSLNILMPMRDAYLWTPFTAVLVLVVGGGFLLGGLRSALLVLGYVGFIALSGWWERAMITAYMVSYAVFMCLLIGLPVGLWAARTQRRTKAVLLFCDTMQTFPSFIYLIPVIMLFQINDVSAIAAVIIYSVIPIIRYTIKGVNSIESTLQEAVSMSGGNKWQRLIHLEMPLALPHIMVGLNQTVMFSLFMVIIAAFIGTQDLGQELMRALSANDVGKGLVLGLCVAFMGMTIDHLVNRWSHQRKVALGID